MLPNKNHKIWVDLVTGKINHNFKIVPASLMISRLKREIAKNNSKDFINQCIDEAYNFFVKYEKLLQDDIKQIFGVSNK